MDGSDSKDSDSNKEDNMIEVVYIPFSDSKEEDCSYANMSLDSDNDSVEADKGSKDKDSGKDSTWDITFPDYTENKCREWK